MAAAFFAAGLKAQDLEILARAHLTGPTPRTERALVEFGVRNAGRPAGMLASMVLARIALEQGKASEAVARMEQARAPSSPIADYADALFASALAKEQRYDEALSRWEAVIRHEPASPLLVEAVLESAKTEVERDAPDRALALLAKFSAELPAAAARFLAGKALLHKGQPVKAAVEFQRVYTEYPLSKEAKDAEAELDALRGLLLDAYPPIMPLAHLDRAAKLIEAGAAGRAAEELRLLRGQLAGADRDVAEVRLGAALHAARRNEEALQHLASLQVDTPEADAERLHYIVALSRRLGKDPDRLTALTALSERHRHSRWRLEALVSSGNRALLLNLPDDYNSLYTACFEDFPASPWARYCHWKVIWSRYLGSREAAPELFQEHVSRFPDSEKRSAALYFLGRSAEERGDLAGARNNYETIHREYPGYYYATLARERLQMEGLSRSLPASQSGPSQQPAMNARKPAPDFVADAATRRRLERARTLRSAALDDWADDESRFAARRDANPLVMAMELARAAQRRGEHARGVRHIKALAPGYLRWSLAEAPLDFWRLAFPLPYGKSLLRHSGASGLDPYLVAAIVRQESEFDPKAVSSAGARGLMQIRPATGRELSRRLRMGRYRSSSLFTVEVNLRIGTAYFRELLDSLGGNLATTLAAYNAGRTRAVEWRGWGNFRQDAEFIETIPFTETRDYVQSVLRNADIYRRLYGGQEQSGR